MHVLHTDTLQGEEHVAKGASDKATNQPPAKMMKRIGLVGINSKAFQQQPHPTCWSSIIPSQKNCIVIVPILNNDDVVKWTVFRSSVQHKSRTKYGSLVGIVHVQLVETTKCTYTSAMR